MADKNQVEISDINESVSEMDKSEGIEKSDAEESNTTTYEWYILQCQTGKEYQVQARINQFLELEPSQKVKVGKVLIPEEDIIEIKNNKRLEKVKRIYPGYVFIELIEEEEIFYKIRRVPGVAKFIGTYQRPTPVADEEILKVLRKIGEKTQKLNVDFEAGENIKVIDGPFTGYSGEISSINLEKGKLKAKILIFGRETPVELDFEQVERITNG
ncbi:MAG: transcription termination/antitermination protein NusG [bacterium]